MVHGADGDGVEELLGEGPYGWNPGVGLVDDHGFINLGSLG